MADGSFTESPQDAIASWEATFTSSISAAFPATGSTSGGAAHYVVPSTQTGNVDASGIIIDANVTEHLLPFADESMPLDNYRLGADFETSPTLGIWQGHTDKWYMILHQTKHL